jgi:hypothetical protein
MREKVRTFSKKVRTFHEKGAHRWQKGAHRWRKSAHRWRKSAHRLRKSAHRWSKSAHLFGVLPNIIEGRVSRYKNSLTLNFRFFDTANAQNQAAYSINVVVDFMENQKKRVEK